MMSKINESNFSSQKKKSIDLKSFQTQPKIGPYHDTAIRVYKTIPKQTLFHNHDTTIQSLIHIIPKQEYCYISKTLHVMGFTNHYPC